MSHEDIAFVALGSNLGDSAAIILRAIAALNPVLRSSLWESEPVDCPPGSPKFINAVVAIRSELEPMALLRRLKEMEEEFGRTAKKALNEPRLLDLDLIAFGSKTCQTPELVLPHPRAMQRRFVMNPLNEIAPDYVFPGATETVSEMVGELPEAAVRRL